MVKRMLAILLCIPCMLLLFSCDAAKKGTKEPPEALPLAFTSKAWVKTAQMELTCSLERKMAGMYTAVVISPQEIQGLTFALEGEVLSVSFEGKQYEMPPSQLPQTSFFSILTSILDAALRTEALTVETQNDVLLVKGGCARGDFQLTQQKNMLQALEIKEVIQATFSEFQASEDA